MTITNKVSNKTLMPGITPIPDVVDAPTIGTATDSASDGRVSVSFTPAITGGTATTYYAVSTPGSITGSSATSPITVSGLTNDTAYTFKTYGANTSGTWSSVLSASSNSATPTLGDIGAYFPIRSYVVPSGGATQITFDNIPSTYTHLQLRCYMAGTYSSAGLSSYPMRFNNDSSAVYAWHELYGTGSSASSSTVGGSQNQFYLERIPVNNTQDYIYGTNVMDILDYTSTSKAKTVRSLAGVDKNGSGEIYLYSALWNPSTPAAITRIDIIQPTSSYTFRQYSSFALYGVKA